MKKLFPLVFAGLLFISCSGLFQDPAPISLTGDVSFAVSRSLLNSAISRADNDNGNHSTAFIVSLAGDYNDSQTIIIDNNNSSSSESSFNNVITFKNVPVGAAVYVEAKIFTYNQEPGSTTQPDFSQINPDAYGRSSTIVIAEGTNYIPLKLFSFYGKFPFTVTLNFDGVSESELSSLATDFCVYGIAKESSLGRSITAAASDNVKIYEALATDVDRSAMGVVLSNINGSSNYTVSGSSVLVNANLYMPIDFTAPAEKGQECLVIASKRTQNLATTPVTYKTKYFGQSTSLIPYKNTQNSVAISVSKMNIIDTPIVTYQSNGNGIMVYTLDSGSTITTDNYSAGFSFDIDGNFYAFKNDGGDTYKILSDKADYNNSATVDVSSMGGYLPNLTVDLKNNILYTYVCNEWSLEVIKHPLFISSGSTSSSTNKSFNFASVEVGGESVSPVPSLCVVNNGMLYVIANDNSSTNLGAFLYKTSFDEWAGNSGDQVPGGVRINLPYGSISDMYYEDGYLYLLVAQDVLPQYLNTNSPIYSRGFIAKYDISSDTIVEMIGSTTNGTPTNTGKLYLYKDRLNLPPYLYRDPEFSIPYTIDKDFSEFFSGTSNTVFPEFFIPSDSQKAFRNPSKIIAIKPKKLVIADDGIAFYTDTDGSWYYKNSDRIITVSLDSFAIESIKSTNSPFEKVVNRDLISENDIIASSHFGSEQTYKIYQQDYGYNPAAASDMKVAIKLKQN